MTKQTDNVLSFKRKPRPLTKTYEPTEPYEVERHDEENGDILFSVTDMRPDSYRLVAWTLVGENPYAKHDAEQIARALNFMVQCGKEKLPNVRVDVENDFFDFDEEDD